jgi:predicted nucleic acid-binding protein
LKKLSPAVPINPVQEEVKQGLWIKRAAVQDRFLLETMPGRLSRGESEAILLAKELGAYLLVDELEARKEASRLGISYFGSLRVIKEAKDRGLIPKAKPVLDELIASSTYLDEKPISAVPPRDERRGRSPAEEVSQYACERFTAETRSSQRSEYFLSKNSLLAGLNRDELIEDWNLCSQLKPPKVIEPLK